jgi:hypothetical protein
MNDGRMGNATGCLAAGNGFWAGGIFNVGFRSIFRNLFLQFYPMNRLLAVLLALSVSASAQESGLPDKNQYAGVKGHPFLQDEWLNGFIKFSNGRKMDQFRLKFDIASNQLLLQFQGSAFAAESKVVEFTMYTKNKKSEDSLLFRKGFPAADGNTAETFYQVVGDGKIKLLRYVRKVISEEKKLVTATNRSFEREEAYYLLKDGSMAKISDDRYAMLSLLPDKSEELKKFIVEQDLKMRSENDYLKVVKKYNELTGN